MTFERSRDTHWIHGRREGMKGTCKWLFILPHLPVPTNGPCPSLSPPGKPSLCSNHAGGYFAGPLLSAERGCALLGVLCVSLVPLEVRSCAMTENRSCLTLGKCHDTCSMFAP
jgi:hypothetical protein